MLNPPIYLIGYASGLAGADPNCGQGPLALQQSKLLQEANLPIHWQQMILPSPQPSEHLDHDVHDMCERLAQEVKTLLAANQSLIVLGGDHTCALGTWNGMNAVLKNSGEGGLIWVDAHMDSHTPETTESGRLHGMPLAALLGYGPKSLTSILNDVPKFKPHHVNLIGVRSFERGEAELLHSLNVRIYYMDEVQQRGFAEVFAESADYMRKNTAGYGISLDLDSIDPTEAPGVDVPEPDGIAAQDIINGLRAVTNDPKLMTVEIVEFDPVRDQNHITEKLIVKFLEILANKK